MAVSSSLVIVLSSCGVVIVVLGSSVVGCIDELFDLPQDVRVMEIIVKRNISNFYILV